MLQSTEVVEGEEVEEAGYDALKREGEYTMGIGT
jgi:hypothetical protein